MRLLVALNVDNWPDQDCEEGREREKWVRRVRRVQVTQWGRWG